MIIDFPPGTGDIQLTTVQKLNIAGAIIITTPQEVATSDARKAAAIKPTEKLSINIKSALYTGIVLSVVNIWMQI